MDFLWEKRQRNSNLVGTTINIHSGEWVRRGKRGAGGPQLGEGDSVTSDKDRGQWSLEENSTCLCERIWLDSEQIKYKIVVWFQKVLCKVVWLCVSRQWSWSRNWLVLWIPVEGLHTLGRWPVSPAVQYCEDTHSLVQKRALKCFFFSELFYFLPLF